jgi:hypothetical protein
MHEVVSPRNPAGLLPVPAPCCIYEFALSLVKLSCFAPAIYKNFLNLQNIRQKIQ